MPASLDDTEHGEDRSLVESGSYEIPADEPAPLEPLGRMAAELAHDLNNQLAAVLNYSFVLERQAGEGLREHVRELQDAAWRASALARKLKVIGRPREAQVCDLELDDVIRDLRPVLAHIAGELPLHTQLPISLPAVRTSESGLEQLIVALLMTVVARAPDGAALVLAAAELPQGGVRLECRIDGELGELHGRQSWAEPNSPADRATLHGVVKRAGARIGHDRRGVWAVLPTSP